MRRPQRPPGAVGGRYRIGCCGWAYDDWKGGFYPTGTEPREYLERYARVFDFVEVDSSFYRAPSPSMVRRWAEVTPDGFLFALKVPQAATHEGSADGAGAEVERFLGVLDPLAQAGKLGPIVAQFPPSFDHPAGVDRLRAVMDAVPAERPLAVELRHRSWWSEEALAPIVRRGAALVWSVRPGARAPPKATGGFLYARFVGDRHLTKFDRLQRDGRAEMETLRSRFESEGFSGLQVYALVNNHFMGFGPGSAQILREVLGLPPLDLTGAARTLGQTTLGGFDGPGPGA